MDMLYYAYIFRREAFSFVGFYWFLQPFCAAGCAPDDAADVGSKTIWTSYSATKMAANAGNRSLELLK